MALAAVAPTYRMRPYDEKKCEAAPAPAPSARALPRRQPGPLQVGRPRALPARRFSPTHVTKICEEVVHAVLDGKAWSGEEQPLWTVTISEQVKARVRGAGAAAAAGSRTPQPSHERSQAASRAAAAAPRGAERVQ